MCQAGSLTVRRPHAPLYELCSGSGEPSANVRI
jgi:hypothetical protein